MIPTLTEEFYHKWINVDVSGNCALKCPRCYRQKPGFIKSSDLSPENFDKISKTFKNIGMMGSASDCIYHHDFISILDVCIKNDNSIRIHTNGHGKTDEWWNKVSEKCKQIKSEFIFALDGLPEDSCLYRINQDGEAVWEVMKKMRKLGHKVTWQYIVFRYNENDIEEAKAMAAAADIEFMLLKSSRWKLPYDPFKPTEHFIERPYNTMANEELQPRCMKKNGLPPAYIMTGWFMPCCDMKASDLKKFKLYHKKFHIDNVTDLKKEVFQSEEWIQFYKDLFDKTPEICKNTCSGNWIYETKTYFKPNGESYEYNRE